MRAALFVLACLLLGSCKNDMVGPPSASGVSVVSGGNQSGTVASTLPNPVTIRVTDSQGRPVSGVAVMWEPLERSGTVASQRATTTAEGIASTTWTLGTVAGDQQLSVQAGSLAPLIVHAVAGAGKPAAVEVASSADSMTAVGDTMWLRATARDAYGNITEGKTIWSSSAPSVVLVDSVGAARAYSRGSATIRALVDGVTGERVLRVTGTAVIGVAGATGGTVANPDGATLTVSAGEPVDLRVSRLGNPWPDQILERPAFGFTITPQSSASAPFTTLQPVFGRTTSLGLNTASQEREVTLEFAVGRTISSVDGLLLQVEVTEEASGAARSVFAQGGALRNTFTYYFSEMTLNAQKDGVIAKFTLQTGEQLTFTAVLREVETEACADQYRLQTPEQSPDGSSSGVPVIYIHGLQPFANVQTCGDWKKNFDVRNFGIAFFNHLNNAGLGQPAQYWIYTYPTFETPRKAAERLASMIRDRFPGRHDIVLVGHSTGGIVGRAAMHLYGADGQVARLITLGSPHQGADVARKGFVGGLTVDLADFFGKLAVLGTDGAKNIIPGTPFITDLNSGPENRGEYYTFAGNATRAQVDGNCGHTPRYCQVLEKVAKAYEGVGANDGFILVSSAHLSGAHQETSFGQGYDHGEVGNGLYVDGAFRFPDPLLERVAALVADVVSPPSRPGAVSVNPASGSWTSSPQNVSVSSGTATRIWYTIRTTTDGSTPPDPPEPSSNSNDGSISGSSGTFQVFANAGENKRLKVRFRGENVVGYGTTSAVYSYAIDRRAAPGAVSVNPASGSWTSSPQDVSVSSGNATRIWYTIRTTTDGSTPPDPPEPSSSLNDGSISGSSGTFQVFANAGENKRLKVRFRGENGVGYGTTSGVHSYAIDRRTAPGAVSVNPASGSWTSSPQDVSVSSGNATRIWYTIRTTTDGSTPADPPEPSSSLNDGSISGSSGTFQVFANAGENKRLKVRFRGENGAGYGAVSAAYSYAIDRRTAPGAVSVNPASGSWTSSPQDVSVSSGNATRVWYTIRTTTDGSTPPDPPEPSSSLNDGSIGGSSGTFQVFANAGENKRLKVRFRGENGMGYGAASAAYSYAIDRRTAPGAVSVNPASGSWTSSPQDVSVSSGNATRIWYTIRTSLDGSTPPDPPEPSSSLNDGSISGSSGTFQVFANAGENKRLKVRFRGENGVGYGTASAAYSYAIDRRTIPGAVSVSPASGSWTSSPQSVSVSSGNATRIWYTIRTTTDGSTPPDPPEPSASLNDGSISGNAGIFQVFASPGQNKRLKVRFRGENGIGYGVTSAVYSYAIDLR